jgi:diguanylate cyclase (GGDEF)-like protein
MLEMLELKFVQVVMVVAGGILLAAALHYSNGIRACQRDDHPVGWAHLLSFVRLFIAAYVGFIYLIVTEPHQHAYLLIATVFLAGGLFVLLAVLTSVRTVCHVSRIVAIERHNALHDRLTGLPNRALLMDRMEQAIRSAGGGELPMALLLMDLNRFKDINDTLGHAFGDKLLIELAPRLNSCIRHTDTVARLGGDEFAFVIEGCDLAAARELTSAILDQVEQPFHLDGHQLSVGACIGIAVYPEHGGDARTLLKHADVAMYDAKRNAERCAAYDAGLDSHSVNRLRLVGDLKQALSGKQLVLCYQPKLNLAAQRVTCVEALVRWNHPELGLILPDDFIPAAEHTGLMRPLTLWVLGEALDQLKRWDTQGLMLNVAINLSVRNLCDPSFPAELAAIVAASGLTPTRLTLEVTETSMMINPTLAGEILADLGDMGFRISIDDFGVGYSSLAYIKQLPARELKIDKSFVINMKHDEGDAVIVHSTIGLAHNMGYVVVAEGVEDSETLDLLQILECDFAQGYHIGRPQTGPALAQWLFARERGDGSRDTANDPRPLAPRLAMAG